MLFVICFRTVEDNESSRLIPNDDTDDEVHYPVKDWDIAWSAVFILTRDSKGLKFF